MIIKKFFSIFILVFLPFYIFGSFKADFYKTLADFVKNPRIFFLDLETDAEENLPLSGRSVGTNILLQTIGVFNMYYNHKIEANDFDLNFGGGIWYFWSIKLIKSIDGLENAKDINMFGASPFISFSKSFESVSFSIGSKLSIGYVSFNFKDVAEEKISDETIKDMIKNALYVKEIYIDPAIFIGMLIESDTSYKGIQIGYNILSSRLFAKIVFGGKVFSFFIGFYPDSPVILHPGINIRF